MSTNKLTPEDRKTLWEQFVREHGKAQEALDNSVRVLAAAGIGVTVSLAAALKTLPGTGLAAVILFLLSLLFNLLSFVSAQLDMNARLKHLARSHDYKGAERSRWTNWTWTLNLAANLALISGGVLVIAFVATTA